MPTEFITVDSKLLVRKNTLTEKKMRPHIEEGFTRFIAFIAIFVLLVYCGYKILEDHDYFFIVQAILVLFWLEPHVKRFYRSLFIKTWKSSIKLNEIQNISTSELGNEIVTKVTLHLKNGRKKFLVFRTAENQVEEFIKALSLPIADTKPAEAQV